MQKECIHQVSDLQKLPYCFPHTPVETHRSLLGKNSVASAVSSSATGCLPGEKQENDLRSKQTEGNPAHNNPNNIHTTAWLPASKEPPSIFLVGGDPVQTNQKTVVQYRRCSQDIPDSAVNVIVFGGSEKEAKRIEFEKSPNSTTFVNWKMNFKSEVCSSSSFPTQVAVRQKQGRIEVAHLLLGTKIFRFRGN